LLVVISGWVSTFEFPSLILHIVFALGKDIWPIKNLLQFSWRVLFEILGDEAESEATLEKKAS